VASLEGTDTRIRGRRWNQRYDRVVVRQALVRRHSYFAVPSSHEDISEPFIVCLSRRVFVG